MNWPDFLARHLVAFQGEYQKLSLDGTPQGEVFSFLYTAFAIALKEQWFLITAGHVLFDLDTALHKRQITLLRCSLLDNLGSNSKDHHPIPFTYNHARKFFLYDEEKGLDYGLIELSAYYSGLLQTNITPFTEKDYKSLGFDFEKYYMIGIPTYLTKTKFTTLNDRAYQLNVSFQAAVTEVKKQENPPIDLQKPYPRFYGKLIDDTTPINVEGMSGGPILGFMRVDERYKYWVIAIQSGWSPASRIIIGCPIDIFLDSMMDQIDNANETK